MINVVELLRTDVAAWTIGRPPRRTAAQSLPGLRPGFVNADTALVYLHRMVDKGFSSGCACATR